MKVTINRLERLSLEDFADLHHLDLVLDEGSAGFIAEFDLPEETIYSPYRPKPGYGTTPLAAITDFAKEISGRFICIAGSQTVRVPKLHVEGVYE